MAAPPEMAKNRVAFAASLIFPKRKPNLTGGGASNFLWSRNILGWLPLEVFCYLCDSPGEPSSCCWGGFCPTLCVCTGRPSTSLSSAFSGRLRPAAGAQSEALEDGANGDAATVT